MDAEDRMATLLSRSFRSSKEPQVFPSPTGPPEPPTEQAAAKDRLVLGRAGRQQLATLPSSSPVEPPFEAPSLAARPFCRHITYHMILSHPGAWSAEPSGQLSGPCSLSAKVRRFMLLAQRMAIWSGRRATGDASHIESSHSMVQMDAAPVSTAAVASSRALDDPG